MHWFYILTGIMIFVSLSGFTLTSYLEKEMRAMVLSITFSWIFGMAWWVLGAVIPIFTLHMSITVWVLIVCGVIFFILPIGVPDTLKIDEPKTERFDERHIMFGRNELKAGTPQYDTYYTQMNPAMKKTDDHIRAMPELGEPGGTYFHEFDSQYMCAVFEYIDKIRHLADPGDPATVPAVISAEEATRRIKGFGKYLGAVDVRTTKLKDYHVYSHTGRHIHNWGQKVPIKHTYAIALAVEMNYMMVHSAPLPPVSTETAVEYLRDANIAICIATFIKNLGYNARAHIDGNYQVFATAVGHDAGLGELGRLGLLITPSHGPRVRTAVVTTDIPLIEDEPINIGVQHFCEICKKCAKNCPSGSIEQGDKREIRGVTKWQSAMESCFQYWKQVGTDCGLCLAVCPYSKPNTLYHNLLRFFIKRNAPARKLAFILDDLFYGKKPRHRHKPSWFTAFVHSELGGNKHAGIEQFFIGS